MKKNQFIIIAISFLLIHRACAFIFVDPTNLVQNTATAINTANQVATQAKQLQAELKDMQNLDSQYRSKFPGYVAPTDYQHAYRDWAQTTHDTLLSTLASAGMQAEQFHTEQSQLNQLATLSRTATGRMQAVQVGNMIATQQVSQLQALRQLVITQINAQNTYAAYQTQKDTAIEASSANWVSASDTAFPVYGKKHDANE